MSARRRFLPMTILAFSMAALALLPSSATAQDGDTASTVRAAKGDLVTGDVAAFAQKLEQIGPDGEVMVWIKETGTPRPSAEFLLNLPGSAPDVIALPAEAPGAKRRNTLGPASVRGASIEAVIRALSGAGAPEPRRMEVLPVFVVKLPEPVRHAALEVLLRHPNVDYVSAVRANPVKLEASPVGANPTDAKHNVHKIPQVWDLTRGSGATIGILDSGLARSAATGAFHDDGRYFGNSGVITHGFIDDLCGSANSGSCSPYDDHGHGTAMVGLVASNDNSLGYVGIAPYATTYSMKMAWNTRVSGQGHCGDNPFNEDSYCVENDDFVRTVDYAAARRFSVLSMSFGGDHNSDVYRALSIARNTYGVFLVAATGNTVGSTEEPASYDVVMGVGGVDAAGNNLYNTVARDVSGYAGGATMAAYCAKSSLCDAGSPSVYGETGGTSAATANVAGIVALIRSYHPNELPSQIWQRLVTTAVGINKVVNAYAAITYKPLSVSIWGNSNPPAYTNQTWSAAVSNGTSPYSYTWYRDGVLLETTGASYSEDVYDTPFQLQLTVTDATGASATSSMWVSPTVQ